jgi:hypothetical protein
VLTDGQRREFEDLGFVRLTGAFGAEDAARMRAVVWEELGRKYGIREHDRTTWSIERPSGLKTSKRHRAFDPIGGPATSGAVDALMSSDGWTKPKSWGQVLVTFPTLQPWVVPHGLWHVDFGYDLATVESLPGLKVFVSSGTWSPGTGARS